MVEYLCIIFSLQSMQPVGKLLACILYCHNTFDMEDGRFIMSLECRKILSFQGYMC